MASRLKNLHSVLQAAMLGSAATLASLPSSGFAQSAPVDEGAIVVIGAPQTIEWEHFGRRYAAGIRVNF